LFKRYELEEIIHSVQGVLFPYLWRESYWIVYEILTGHYFEALRDLRLMFEGSLLPLAYDCLVDAKTYEESGFLVAFDVKAEMIEIAERLREKRRQLGNIDDEKFESSVREEVWDFIRDKGAGLDEKTRREYIEVYSKVLVQPGFYYSVPKLITEFVRDCNLEEFEEKLKKAWAELYLYTLFDEVL